jgi:NAD(P)-dependent dehydrogenase (short-subunit alcohol dehydrogenase family)
MTDRKVWFITGAARGMGVDFAKAALAAGHAVVATGRRPDAVTQAVGTSDDLLVVKLDVTSLPDAQVAVRAAVDRFGRIDVLVNNAANFYAGYFEELTPEEIERQLATSLIGPMNVTRAILPVMRKQRAGHIISISSSAGLAGFEFCTAYAERKAPAAPLHRRRRCHRHRRAEGGRSSGPDPRVPRALVVIGIRRRVTSKRKRVCALGP